MEALPGRGVACQYCRKFGSYATFTIQEDNLAAEERCGAFSDVMMSAAAMQQSKPLPLPEKKGNGPTDRGDWRLVNDHINILAE